MKFKPKPWHKIVKISIVCILAVLILFNTILTNYLRKNIEKTYSQLLNADVSIEDLRINYLNGSIKLFNILILGKNEFFSDTLLSAKKFVIRSPELNKNTGTIILNELFVENLKMVNIISENGNSCWDVKTTPKSLNEEENLSDFKFFVNKLILQNTEITTLNRQTGKSQSYSNISVEINSKHVNDDIISSFNAECSVKYDKSESHSLAISGNSNYNENTFEATATFEYNKFPVLIDVFVSYDSLSLDTSHIIFSTDFSKLPKQKNIETNGKLELELYSAGIFNKDIDFNFTFKMLADSITFSNPYTNSSLKANFDSEICYFYDKNEFFSIATKNMMLISDSDTLKGYMDYFTSDSIIYANSDISGSFNTNILNDIFEDQTFLTGVIINSSSNLNGKITQNDNQLSGQYITDIEISNPNFNIPELNIVLSKNIFQINSYIVSDYVTGKLQLSISKFKNMFDNSNINKNINIDISALHFPELSNNGAKFIPEFKSSGTFRFAQNSETETIISIDSLFIADKIITNLRTRIISTPVELAIYDINLDVGEAKLFGEYHIKKEQDIIVTNNSFTIKNLDLSYFANSNLNISGLVNCQINNTLYSANNEQGTKSNRGENTLKLENFKLMTETLNKYEINEDNINIKNADIKVILDGNFLYIEPTYFSINEANLSLKASYNFLSDSISLVAITDIPDSYLSPRIKLLMGLFVSDSETELPKKPNRSFYIFEISGLLDDPEYSLYE